MNFQKIILILCLGLLSACAAGKIEGEGTESREKIRKVIRAAMPEIKQCYEVELAKNPKLEGKIVVKWTTIAGGKVTDESIKSSTLKNENVHACVLAVFRKQTFPEPPQGNTVVVDYPFLFNPQADKKP